MKVVVNAFDTGTVDRMHFGGPSRHLITKVNIRISPAACRCVNPGNCLDAKAFQSFKNGVYVCNN